MTARTRSPRGTAVIRPYQPRDRQAVRDICCKTAFRNMGSDRIFEDREIHADYWTKYYTDIRPEYIKVIEEDGALIGYFFAAPDRQDFVRAMGRIVPWCIARALWRLATGRYKRPESRRYLMHAIFHAWKEEPKLPYDDYPATYHCNILRKGYGRRYYTQLLLEYLDELEARGIHGIHGHITEPRDKGTWQRFEERYALDRAAVFAERPNTLFRQVLGEETPMVNRGWAVPIEGFRKYVLWLRDTMRI